MTDIASLGIKVTTQGVSSASNDLDRLDKSARGASKAASALGKSFAALGGGYLIGRGIAAIVNATIEAEQAQAQLAAVLKSTGGAAGLSATALNAMADSLQAVTTFDDEAITGAQSLLLTFTKIGRDVFPEATEAVLDMSQALGQDLKSSAVQLGKALNDPVKGVTALQRVGVSFSKEQKKVIETLVETGRVADAQRLILKELQTEFGGSARAARDTLGGAFKALKNSASNLLEGDSGSEGLVGVKDAVNDLTDALNDPDVKRGFADMIAGLAKVAQFAAEAITAVTGLARAASDSFAINSEKSYVGLLQRRFELQEKIANGGRLPKSKDPLANLLGITNSGQIAKAKKELVEVDAQLRKMRLDEAAAKIQFIDPPGPGFSTKGSGASTEESKKKKAALTDEEKAARALQEAYERLNESMREQIALFNDTSNEARVRYQVEQGELARLTDAQKAALIVQAQKLDQLAKEQEQRERAIELEEQERKAIEDHKKVVQDLLDDIAFETKLLGLSNEEKEKQIALRRANVDAASAEGQAISQAIDARQAIEDQVEGLDNLREAGADLFVDLTDGVGSWKDAFADALDDLRKRILRMIAERLMEQLFGATGTNQTGQSGAIGSFLGALFGGARAEGGPVSPGKFYEVGEKNRPELLSTNGRTYLIPGNSGSVTPATGGGGPVSLQQTFHVPGAIDRRTQEQLARETGREAQRGIARTGR